MAKINKGVRRGLMMAAVAWVAFIAVQSWQRWPQVPLDMNATDQQTAAVYHEAVQQHLMRSAGLALIVPALVWGALALLRGPSGEVAPATHPARILLMRHAEKPDDPEDFHLSDTGRVRAQKLASYIPKTFGKPDIIFAARRSKRSNRSVETMEPLAAATGVPVDKTYDDDKPKALIARLISDTALAGKTVVICWHHSDLPKIARSLGVPEASVPDDWDPQDFKTIIDIRYHPDRSVSAAQVVPPF